MTQPVPGISFAMHLVQLGDWAEQRQIKASLQSTVLGAEIELWIKNSRNSEEGATFLFWGIQNIQVWRNVYVICGARTCKGGVMPDWKSARWAKTIPIMQNS